ncbi:16S rRNA (uracil(1498)-N(3))-methyltransferase [Pelosinus sp. sgz500959]|uniref:16S rRNA (uracil(1498)-N(3))-methyltransferase n=1 Tax=Pelosinus sp. sgz500959 TaxID=3242472 RepID=UPI003670AD2B
MRRFFIETPLVAEMSIQGSDAHHMSRVLRLQVGDQVIAVSPDGSAGVSKIKSIGTDEVILVLQEILREDKEAPIHVDLVQGLPKSDKMDYIVQKAVELGVRKIYPMEAEHSVVQYDQAKKSKRQERWQKIAVEAAKQCGRGVIPTVEPVTSLANIVTKVDADTLVIMLYEGQAAQGIKEVLTRNKATHYLLIVGPEGGFSAKEVALCQDHGVSIVTLGPRILRTETAALAGVSIVMYESGDLGG